MESSEGKHNLINLMNQLIKTNKQHDLQYVDLGLDL